MNPLRKASQFGMTLIESSIVLSIAAVVVGMAAPSFEAARERRQLEGVAAQLETDVMFTRSLAVARNQSLRLSFVTETCYVVHAGDIADCRCGADGQARCAGDVEPLRVVQLGADARVTLQSNSASMLFDATRGTVTPTATVQVRAASGATIRNIVNIMGRVRSCAPAPGLPGYASC